MGKVEDKVYYLDDERRKLWAKVLELEKKLFVAENNLGNLAEDVKNKTSDYEASAKQASKKTSEFRNKSEEAKNCTLQYLDEAKLSSQEVAEAHQRTHIFAKEISDLNNQCIGLMNNIEATRDAILESHQTISNHVSELDATFSNLSEYQLKLEKLDAVVNKGEEYLSKTDALFKSVGARKKEIDEVYYEIVGFTDTDETTGEDTEVSGLKDELETTYDQLKSNLALAQTEINDIKNQTISDYTDFSKTKAVEFDAILSDWKMGYFKLTTKIEELLPNALTTGLSHAYSKKKETEIEESAKIAIKFEKAVQWMVYVSLIPFGFSIASWILNKDLDKVLLDMPRLVLSILPLYIPFLWLAYSANKNLKLSKRLIEEYTHKEVLSKTFEGLSKQIENIGDSSISQELRIKLLYNILEVNSENPGKLITDYDKSDHPLMDALDKSVKLSNAVDRLTDIPGLGKLAKHLDRKSKRLIRSQRESADDGLELISQDIEDNDIKKNNAEVG